jgi:putative heme-binding domain-containing protein
MVSDLAKDPSANVRAQLIRTLEATETANAGTIAILVNFCHAAATDNELGKGYQIDFERYLARRALERHPSELRDYLHSTAAKDHPSANILWAQQALPTQTAQSFLEQWQEIKTKPLDHDTLVILSDVSEDAAIKDAILPYFREPKNARHIANLAMENIADVYAPSFGYPIAETVQTLIKSKEKSDIILGLQLGRAYRITHQTPQFAELLSSATDANIIEEIIKNLSHLPKGYEATLLAIMQDEKYSTRTRLVALSAYAQAAGPAAKPAVTDFLSKNTAKKSAVISSLGSTVQGCQLLVHFVADNIIGMDDISDTIGRRIRHLDEKSPAAIAIHENVEKRATAASQASATRVPELEKQITEKPGDPIIGKSIFTGMCLTCHVVGEEGAGIGPALDGSANRDTNHLLTAILNPDEAAENAYILFRVIDSSGQIEEGFKARQDSRGTTLANQGGTTVFMPSRTLKQQSHVGSVSFMPSSAFDRLPVNVIADLVAYLKTLQ